MSHVSLPQPIAITKIETFPPRTCLTGDHSWTYWTKQQVPLSFIGNKDPSHETLKETVHSAKSMPSTPKGSGVACHFPLPLLVGTRKLVRVNRTGSVNEFVPHSAQEPRGLLCPFLYLILDAWKLLCFQACWKFISAGLNIYV